MHLRTLTLAPGDLDQGALKLHYNRLHANVDFLSAPECIELFRAMLEHAGRSEVEAYAKAIGERMAKDAAPAPDPRATKTMGAVAKLPRLPGEWGVK